MFNTGFDNMFLTSHYVNGLRDDIRNLVQPQLLDLVDRASLLARLQQQVLERTKARTSKTFAGKSTTMLAKFESS
jgi:hypothetical protein